jgi:hypothetical protein
VRRELDKPADLLRMDFYVIAIRPPADSSVRTGPGLSEGPVDVLAKLVDPLDGKRPFQPDDAVGVDPVTRSLTSSAISADTTCVISDPCPSLRSVYVHVVKRAREAARTAHQRQR